MNREFVLFGGSANPELARAVARALGGTLGRSEIERFPDGEVSVRLGETVRRKEVFIVQPTGPPVDENLVELLCFADAARRAAADRVTAIISYFGYARADKRAGSRQAIAARMVGDVLQAAGVDHVITVDLHAAQIEGFFTIPIDTLTAVPLLAEALRERDLSDTVVVSPDEGRVRMATEYAQRLDVPLVIMNKRRESSTETEVGQIVGDVEGRRCIVIDDMIATGGTLVGVNEALLAAGALPDITIAATHGLLLPGAREKLDIDEVREIVVTDTLPTPHPDWPRLRVLSIAPTIATAVHAFVADGSLSPLF
jgi:ribose-phosphate pyrophosphokinase